MNKPVQLWDWEKDVLRHMLYVAPDGGGHFLSVREIAKNAGHPSIHPDKLRGFASKLVLLGYGKAEVIEIEVSIDVNFQLSSIGYAAATELVRAKAYKSPVVRVAEINWSAIAAVVSALAAIASAIFAYRVAK